MIIPCCSGMQRSASRVTWQIVREILGDTLQPKDYVFPPEWKDLQNRTSGIEELDWPCRTHNYISDVPAIYTYRHPVEALLSFWEKLKLDMHATDALSSALNEMGKQEDNVRDFLRDASNGRQVLFLRYEDYYDKPRQRIVDIANFMEKDLGNREIEKIYQSTSLEKNHSRGIKLHEEIQDWPWQGTIDSDGMQKLHVSPQTMGKPGSWLAGHSKYVEILRKELDPSSKCLVAFTKFLGYEI